MFITYANFGQRSKQVMTEIICCQPLLQQIVHKFNNIL